MRVENPVRDRAVEWRVAGHRFARKPENEAALPSAWEDPEKGWRVEVGDALDLVRRIPDGHLDAIVTDPPYSSGGQFRGDRAQGVSTKYVQSQTHLVRPEFGGDNRDGRGYLAWVGAWVGELQRAAKPGAALLMFCDWRQLPLTTDAMQAGGFVWRGIVPWDKTEGTRPQMGRFRSQCEYVVWGTNGPVAEERAEDIGVLPGLFRQSRRGVAITAHVTAKPVELMRFLVGIAPRGGLVLDPFTGSGSTGVACVLDGRRFLGFEREQVHAEIAVGRLEAETKQDEMRFGDDAAAAVQGGLDLAEPADLTMEGSS